MHDCLTIVSLVSSCEPPDLEPAATASTTVTAADQQSIGSNPFSVALMREAYASLSKTKESAASRTSAQPDQDTAPATGSSSAAAASAVPSGCPTCPSGPELVQATHLYLRFKAANTDQLADLDDTGFRLSWEPMDESVAAVTTVNFQSNDIAWIYTVVPVGTPLPASIQREQIQELFLFNVEDGDAQEADPWVPTPGPDPDPCAPQYSPSCNCYVQCRTASTNKEGKFSNWAKATQKLKNAGISPLALYNEAMRLSGNPGEVLATPGPGTQARSQRYHPRGTIRVEDTDLGMVPLRGVKVESRRWFQFGSTFTNSQGSFDISTSYKSKAKISLEFKNNLATTRGIISGVRVWQAVLPINTELGLYEDAAMENVAYDISFQGGLSQRESKGASTWSAATLFNTLADEQSFAAARGLPAPPQSLNVWLFPDFPPRSKGAGAAPMLRKMAATSIVSQVVDFLLLGSGMANLALIKQIVQRQLPDISIRYSNDQGAMASHQLQPLLYHELGHTQHYDQVGNNFWAAYVAYIVWNRGYGDKSSSGSGRIAVSEGWGNYVEQLFMVNKYQGTITSFRANAALFYLDEQIPTDTDDVFNQGWFVYGMYHDMTDSTPEPSFTTVTDNVTAYTPVSVFRGLQSDVLSVRDYQSKVNTQNNGLQSFEMGQLVTSYRW